MNGKISKHLSFIAASQVTNEGYSSKGRFGTKKHRAGAKEEILRGLKKQYKALPHNQRYGWLKKRLQAAVELVEIRTKFEKQAREAMQKPKSTEG